MKEIFSIAVIVATLFGGTKAAQKIYVEVRQAALTKAAQGLPNLSDFTKKLTNESKPFVDKKLKR